MGEINSDVCPNCRHHTLIESKCRNAECGLETDKEGNIIKSPLLPIHLKVDKESNQVLGRSRTEENCTIEMVMCRMGHPEVECKYEYIVEEKRYKEILKLFVCGKSSRECSFGDVVKVHVKGFLPNIFEVE